MSMRRICGAKKVLVGAAHGARAEELFCLAHLGELESRVQLHSEDGVRDGATEHGRVGPRTEVLEGLLQVELGVAEVTDVVERLAHHAVDVADLVRLVLRADVSRRVCVLRV